VDFTDNYASVVNDITWRIKVIAMIIWGLDALIIDVETAFLYGNLGKRYTWTFLKEWREHLKNACYC